MRPILPAPWSIRGHRCARRPRVDGCRCSPPPPPLLDHLLATAQRDGRLPSVAAGLVRGGELVWSGAAGTVDGRADGRPADDDTQYRMGSITKTFVAVVRAAAARRRAARAAPTGSAPTCPARPSTTSASSSCSPTPPAPRPRPRARGGSARPAATGTPSSPPPVGQRFRAGRRFHYSNVGYAALGRLLEVHHGRGWFDVVRDELLEPLGMTRTTTRPVGVGGPRAGRAPVRRRAAARARARRRRDGARPASCGPPSPTWPAGRRSSAARRRACCRPTPSPRWSSRTTSSTTRASRGSRRTAWAVQVWNVGGARFTGHGGSMPGLPRRHPGPAGCRCAGGRFGRRFRWERRHGIRTGGRSGR